MIMEIGVQKKIKSKSLYHKCCIDKERIEVGEKYLLTGNGIGTMCEYHGKEYVLNEIKGLVDIYNELSSNDKILIKTKSKGK